MEKDYNYVKNKVSAHGNGAKVIVPKDWIGQEVYVIPQNVWDAVRLNAVMEEHRFRAFRGRRKKS